jgi:hypothetical protein
MARVQLIQTNFTAGEISPRCLGRTDIPRYQDGAELAENAIILVHGGAMRRWGLRMIAETKDSGSARSRLAPYVFNVEQAFILELGAGYVRFCDPAGQVVSGMSPYEVIGPWTAAQVLELDYAQSGDTMILTHQDVAPYRLRRFTATNWTLGAVPFVIEPYGEIGDWPAAALTLSSAAVGSRTVTAGAACFLGSDVGRGIAYLGGYGVITAVADTTHCTLNVIEAFAGTAIPSGAWNRTSSPQAVCTPSAKDPVGATIMLTLDVAGWRAGDVGKHVLLNAGLVRITVYTSPTVVSGVIVQELAATVGAPALAWTLEASVWGGVNGYPRTVTFREQRTWFAGSPGFPLAFWGSVIAESLNYTLGTEADDAVFFSISSDEYNPIRHMTSAKALLVLTSGISYSVHGGPELPVMPTNVQIKDQSDEGTCNVRPVRAKKEVLVVDSSGLKIHALSPDRYDSGQYEAPEITALAEHITESGLIDAAFTKKPDKLMLCPRADGVMAAGTIDREQDVIAWGRWITQGDFEAIAVIPVPGGEQVWAIVKRTIDGEDKRFIERFEADLQTDCCVTGTSGPGTATWTAPHLANMTVDVLADGVDMGAIDLDGAGSFTLPRIAYEVEIGLNYIYRLKTLNPELGLQTGSAQGTAMSISEITVKLLASIGGKINGKELMHRNTGLGVLDQAPEAYTGNKSLKQLGWLKGVAQLDITQDRPYPFHVLSVTKTLTAGDN